MASELNGMGAGGAGRTVETEGASQRAKPPIPPQKNRPHPIILSCPPPSFLLTCRHVPSPSPRRGRAVRQHPALAEPRRRGTDARGAAQPASDRVRRDPDHPRHPMRRGARRPHRRRHIHAAKTLHPAARPRRRPPATAAAAEPAGQTLRLADAPGALLGELPRQARGTARRSRNDGTDGSRARPDRPRAAPALLDAGARSAAGAGQAATRRGRPGTGSRGPAAQSHPQAPAAHPAATAAPLAHACAAAGRAGPGIRCLGPAPPRLVPERRGCLGTAISLRYRNNVCRRRSRRLPTMPAGRK